MAFARVLAIAAALCIVTHGVAHAIEVGDVLWLSSKGIGRTVVATAAVQQGVVRVDYKMLDENASEYCQRYEQLKRGSDAHDSCVSDALKNATLESVLVNCRTRVLVLKNGAFAKGADHFWRSKTDENSFVLGDELFQKTCGVAARRP